MLCRIHTNVQSNAIKVKLFHVIQFTLLQLLEVKVYLEILLIRPHKVFKENRDNKPSLTSLTCRSMFIFDFDRT